MSERRCGDAVALSLTAAICVAAFFLVGWQFIERRTEQRVSEHYSRQNDQSVSPVSLKALCGSLPPGMIADCIIQKYQEQDRWDKERRDLNAQESMAFWAAGMFVLTALALVAIVRTLHHTGRAADSADEMLKEARKTTEAANDTVVETRRIGDAQVHVANEAVAAARDANRVAAQQFQAGFKPWISVELTGTFLSSTRNDHFNGFGIDEKERSVRVTANALIQSLSDIPATIEDFDMRVATGKEWPYADYWRPGRSPDINFFVVLRAKDSVQVHPCTGIVDDEAAPSMIDMPIGYVEMTPENRVDVIQRPPPIVGWVIYSDPMGIRYKHHFAFISKPAGRPFKRYGGQRLNYEEKLE